MLGRIVPGRVARLDVDLDKGLAGGIEQCPVFPSRVARRQFGADHHHQIGLGHASIPGLGAEGAEHAEGERVGLGEAALACGRRRHRDSGGLGQPAQLVIGLGDAHAVAGDQHRLLRREDRPGGRLDARGVCGRRRWRKVVARWVEYRLRVGPDRAGERVMGVEHGDRTRLSGERMFDRELCRLHRTDRVVRLHDVLGDAAEGAPRVPAPPIPGRLLVGRMQGEPRRVAEIGQQQHRRARQICLDGAEQPVAEHPGPLPEQHARPPRQTTVNLGHDPAQ